jgi:hypothetical protein
MSTPLIIERIIYRSYTQAQKRATDKWNKANWDRVLANERGRYYRRKEQNKPFIELTNLVKAIEHPEYVPPPPKRKYHRKFEREEP